MSTFSLDLEDYLSKPNFSAALGDLAGSLASQVDLPKNVDEVGLVCESVLDAANHLKSKYPDMPVFFLGEGSPAEFSEYGKEIPFTTKVGFALYRGVILELAEPGVGCDIFAQTPAPKGKIMINHLGFKARGTGLVRTDNGVTRSYTELMQKAGIPKRIEAVVDLSGFLVHVHIFETMSKTHDVEIEFLDFRLFSKNGIKVGFPGWLVGIGGWLQEKIGPRFYKLNPKKSSSSNNASKPIYTIQEEKKDDIARVLNKYRGTADWEKSRLAFHEIITKHIHGTIENMSSQELDTHFERAIVTTSSDISNFQDLSKSALSSEKDSTSAYYLLNVKHHRNDNYFATNQQCPVTGTGSKRLDAKFEAQNLYQRQPINASSAMPSRVLNSPFPTWSIIQESMTNRDTYDQIFYFSDPNQADEIFQVTSSMNWYNVQGVLFITPDLFGGAVFSPALYSVYFFAADQNSPYSIFFFVSADGRGNPEKAFVGLVNNASSPSKNIYSSINRYSFTYISSEKNPTKYWMNLNDPNLSNFSLNIQVFYPSHPTPYIEVVTDFSAQVPWGKIAYFKDTPGLSTILLLQKGTLMRDLIKAYFPDSTSAQLWIDVTALTKGPAWLNDLEAIGMDAMADIFSADVWEEKPTVLS